MQSEGMTPTLAERAQTAAEGLRLAALRLSQSIRGGTHRSERFGASSVFVEHRAYQHGDDPRRLDWKAYARSDRYVVKRFEQEAQLRSLLAIDKSASMRWSGFDEQGPEKLFLGQVALGALSHLLLTSGDEVSCLGFGSALHGEPTVARGAGALHLALRSLAEERVDAETRFAEVNAGLADRAPYGGALVIVSDFIGATAEDFAPLASLRARGVRLALLQTLHADELTLSGDEAARFEGLEGEDSVLADPQAVAEAYRTAVDEFIRSIREVATQLGATYGLVSDDASLGPVLRQLLEAL